MLRSPKGALLLGLGPRGVERLPEDVPTVWVTTPTQEKANVGFAVNGPFAVHPGRAKLAQGAADNSAVAETLGEGAGTALCRLFDFAAQDWQGACRTLGLAEDTTPYGFWASVWQILGPSLSKRFDALDSHEVREIVTGVLWLDRARGMARLLASHSALPSELWGAYQTLTSVDKVHFMARGVLDTREAVFRTVAEWSEFRAKYPTDGIVSGQRTALPLRALCPSLLGQVKRISLVDVVDDLAGLERKVVPGIAARLGLLVTTDLLGALRNGKDPEPEECEAIEERLRGLLFRARDGSSYQPASDLLIAASDGESDEAMRATFAPRSRVLDRAYEGPALDFFRCCRGRLEAAGVEAMAEWALDARDDSTRKEALNYLLKGELSNGLAELLRKRASGSWLSGLNIGSALLQDFELNDRFRLLAMLDLIPPEAIRAWGPVQPRPPSRRDPATVLNDIAAWWRQEGAHHIRQYERSVYPDGRRPTLCTDTERLRHDVEAREAWLELMMVGATFTIGRSIPGQHAAFLRFWRERGWLRRFADPSAPREQRLRTIEEYFRDTIDNQEFFNWLQRFVSFYQLSRWLDDYVELFLGLGHGGPFALWSTLSPRTAPAFQGGIDAPPLGRTLGIGACFVIRELARRGVLTTEHVHRYCYVPRGRVRQLMDSLGCPNMEDEIPVERSTVIYDYLHRYLGIGATFDGTFDLPLVTVAYDRDLWSRFLDQPQPEMAQEGDEEVEQ
ncbi:MAG: hypothetical protein Q8P50_03365 [Bacillota bacterium]|nr:hypothetical protein [Bacillota bacterium]